ncbi:MAG TPA: MFS transporter, partial [Anaerolineaceae bacterium]|nr:MFS transporter [Anaerolineaceae bacterium]
MSTQPILPPDMESKEKRNHRHNYIANLIDGGFFGFAMGFASFTTVIPLFVSSMTSSAVLIGLIPAIHSVGWQFPQLLTARRVARLIRLKPAVLFLTIQERLPFLGLAIVAWFLPDLGKNTVLVLTFLFLIWQGLGSGFTANAWQNLIVRIIPGDERGTFLGLQSAAANLLASLGAFLAGLMLDQFPYPMDFSICFLAAVGCYVLSWFALSQVRELADPGNARESLPEDGLWNQVSSILKRDRRFRGYLVTRMLSQFAMMSFAFYTVYAVRFHHMNEVQAGILTSVLLLTQVIANPVLGRLSDRISKKMVLEIGAFAALLSSLIAWIAPQVGWFYLVIILSGIANTAYWTIGMAYTLEFGSDQERPTYIGLANTLIAPSTILAPIVGGWLADLSGYPATFISSA